MRRAVPLALAALHRAELGVDHSLAVEDDDLMAAELGLSRGGKDLTILLVPVPRA